MDTNLRPSGIEGLGDISWGTHFCVFYETKEDLLDLFLPFFKAGLEHREFCLCVASEPLITEEAERAMRQAFPEFEHYLAQGQLEITPHTDWYLKEGHFDEERVLQGWMEKLDQALARGFSGVRFAANIVLEESEWKSFAQYEGKLEETLHDLPIAGLCAYKLNRYTAANLLDVLRHHQFSLARRDGTWEPIEGINLKRAHKEVLKLNAELEQRVMERTAELTSVNEQLKALSRRLVEAEESERKRLAREIHDDISQSLTALTMQLGSARNVLPKSATAARSILKETEALTQSTLEHTRLMIAGLRPSILDELGLIPALHRLADELRESTGVIVTLKANRLPGRLPPQIEIALFRTVQEALINIRKHAQASEVIIELTKETDRLILFVQDNGVGIENQEAGSQESDDVVLAGGWKLPAGHFGLIGIQERVKLLGGNFQLTSAPNQGTTIRVELPL
jgi:signal transduction histidine kinase